MMTEIALALLELYPAMALDKYEGPEFYGEKNGQTNRAKYPLAMNQYEREQHDVKCLLKLNTKFD